MKIGWLVWYDQEDKDRGELPTFTTVQPNSWDTFVQIAYAEIIK